MRVRSHMKDGRPDHAKGFARIQCIMKGLYAESNVPQFSGSSWRPGRWESAADELINSTAVTFIMSHRHGGNSQT